MKYLVNRETKEHRLHNYGEEHRLGSVHGKWDIVEADDEGWIKWDGGKCPLPNNHGYDVKVRDGDIIDGQHRPQDNTWWGGIGIVAYRPILPAESKPEHQRVLDEFKSPFGPCPPDAEPTDNVFTRLSAAVSASEQIPALIAEINAMLPEGYSVTQTAQVMAEPETHPSWDKLAEDMSDWRNWKKGDLVTCINGHGWTSFVVGGSYRVTDTCNAGVYIEGLSVNMNIKDFKFHSRPVTK